MSEHLSVLLDPDQIVPYMHEAYRRVRLDATAYGCFMMGPSATADIQATLVHGAQGPRSLNVFFFPGALMPAYLQGPRKPRRRPTVTKISKYTPFSF